MERLTNRVGKYINYKQSDVEKVIQKLADYEDAEEQGFKEIRNKAIDEFVSRLEKHTQENWVDHQEYGITWSDIEQIAEQMKRRMRW